MGNLSSNDIQCIKKDINQVFEAWYSIPSYQRPYVWEKTHVEALVDDIYQSQQKNENNPYFLGTLILEEEEKEGKDKVKFFEYKVLDGQQRLTTLFLLYAVVHNLTTNEDMKEACKISVYRKQNEFKNIPERVRIIFDSNVEVNEFIKNIIVNNEFILNEERLLDTQKNTKNISIIYMIDAILTIKKYFITVTEETNKVMDAVLGDFIHYLGSKVSLILVSTRDLNNALDVFTVLNHRGIQLKFSDILKINNLNAISDKEQVEKFSTQWRDIEEYFANDTEDFTFEDFLSTIRTIYVKDKPKFNLLKEFTDNIFEKKLLLKGDRFFDVIKKYKDCYEVLFNNKNKLYSLNNGYEILNLLTIMKAGFESKSWIAPLLMFYDKFYSNSCSLDELYQFLKKLDNKYSYDIVVGLNLTQRNANVFNILKAIDKSDDVETLLSDKCFEIELTKLESILSKGNVYEKKLWGVYILLKLEFLLFNNKDTYLTLPRYITVEHVLPQTMKADSEWKKNFNDKEHEEWLNRLGNLVLLSQRKNSSLSNCDYDDKKMKYFKTSMDSFNAISQLFNDYTNWTPEDVKKRHKENCDKIIKSYK